MPLLDLKAQYASIREEVREAVDRVLDSQAFILGPEVEKLEKEIAEYSQCGFGIGVSSGTDALLVSLMALGVGPGDEVITSPYSFFATAGAIARLGTRPVFVDIEPRSYNIDASLVESAVTGRSKAIIPVHLFGQVAEMDPIMDVARRHHLYVIEDAAQAIGAEYGGRRAGSIGHLGALSFYPSKNLGGIGDGGMVTTSDPDLADRIRLLRNHGFRPKYHNRVLGGNFRLDALQAAVLRVKLRHLDEWTRARQHNATVYRRLFRESGLVPPDESPTLLGGRQDDGKRSSGAYVALPTELPERTHVYNQFVIRTAMRDALRSHLQRCAIGTEIYYPVPLHLQDCFAGLGYKAGDFPVSERAAKETLALPIYPELTEEALSTVVGAIAGFLASNNA